MWFSPMAYSIQRYVIFMCVQLLLREKWCPMRKRLQKYYIRDTLSNYLLDKLSKKDKRKELKRMEFCMKLNFDCFWKFCSEGTLNWLSVSGLELTWMSPEVLRRLSSHPASGHWPPLPRLYPAGDAGDSRRKPHLSSRHFGRTSKSLKSWEIQADKKLLLIWCMKFTN